MSLKYMQYMPFFSSLDLRGISDLARGSPLASRGWVVSPEHGTTWYPYLEYPSNQNNLNAILPYSALLFIVRIPSVFLGGSHVESPMQTEETGPNVFRLENLMWTLDQICIQHKWKNDNGFDWKITNGEEYKVFIPEPTFLTYTTLTRNLGPPTYKIEREKGFSNLVPFYFAIDFFGGPIQTGWPYGLISQNPKKIEGVSLNDYRDYNWIYKPNTGQLSGITFNDLYIYQQLQKTWEEVGKNLFIDIPGKNYDVDIPVTFSLHRKRLTPVDNPDYYDDDKIYQELTINVKRLESLWTIPGELWNPETESFEDWYYNLDTKPGWLPLGPDVNSINDYSKLVSITNDKEIFQYLHSLAINKLMDEYLTKIPTIYYTKALREFYRAKQYNYFNQFFLPADTSAYWSQSSEEDFAPLLSNDRKTVNFNGPTIPQLFEEITFGGISVRTDIIKYSKVSASQNESVFDEMQTSIEDIGMSPYVKLHAANHNLLNGANSPNGPANLTGNKTLLYLTMPTIKFISSFSTANENIFRDVSEDVEVVPPSQPNGLFIFYQKYTSPKYKLYSSKFNNQQAQEKAEANLVHHGKGPNGEKLLNLTYGSTGTSTVFNFPMEPDKLFVVQSRVLMTTFLVSGTYVGNKSLRSKLGIRNRVSNIDKVYSPFVSNLLFDTLRFLSTNQPGTGVGLSPFLDKERILKFEKDNGIVSSTDTSFGPASIEHDGRHIRYYYGWVQFPDNIVSKDNFDMLSTNNYIKLCKYIVDSNPQKTLLFEIPEGDLFLYHNGIAYKRGTKETFFNVDMFLPREALCDFDAFLDAEPPFDNAVLFLWAEPTTRFPSTRAAGHVTNGSFELAATGIAVTPNENVSSTDVWFDGTTVGSSPDRIPQFVYYDNNGNVAQTNTVWGGEKIASFYVMSHNTECHKLPGYKIFVSYTDLNNFLRQT